MYPSSARPNWGTFVASQVRSLEPLGVESDLLEIEGYKSKWNYLRAIFEMRRRIRTKSYDIIHAHYGLSGLVARCQRRVPLVISFCGADLLGRVNAVDRITFGSWVLAILHRWLAHWAEAVIVKSAEMVETIPDCKPALIANGVDFDMFRPLDRNACRRELGLKESGRYICFPYDPLEKRKNFAAVQDAVTLLNAERKKTSPASDSVEILVVNDQPHDRVPLYLNASDALVLPSFSEGSPNAVKEALVCNVAVVATAVGDIPELISHIEGCYIVAPTSEAVADGLRRAFAHGGRVKARERLSRLSTDTVGQSVLDVYIRVLRKRNSSFMRRHSDTKPLPERLRHHNEVQQYGIT
jgi:glycosyltransferase involved in cell wall biosynthesis